MSIALVSVALGEKAAQYTESEPFFIYNGVRIGVFFSECCDDQDTPYFDIRYIGSEISVFSVKNGLNVDFYVIRNSALASCFSGLSVVGLSMIAPVALHVKADRLKQAVDLAIQAA